MRATSMAANDRLTRSMTNSYTNALSGEGSAARDMDRAIPQGLLVPNPSPTLALALALAP